MRSHFSTTAVTFGLCLALFCPLRTACAAATESVAYREDFEEADPVKFWVTNGKHEVHFKGTTDEAAFSGQRSFKLDVTLKSGRYHYWSIPVKLPCAGELKFSGRIRVEKPTNAKVGLGVNFVFPPTHHSGCGPIGTFGDPTGEWMLQECDLVQRGGGSADAVIRRYTAGPTGENVVAYVDRWAIFIYGSEGQRVVVHVDDVRIEGRTPPAREHDAEAARRWQPAREAWQARIAVWGDELASTRKDIEALDKLPPVASRMREIALRAADDASSALAKLAKVEYALPQAAAKLEEDLNLVRHARPNLIDMSKPGVADRPFVTYVCRPITNAKILPSAFPIVGRIGDRLSVTACAGEYEPATFALCAFEALKGLRVSTTPLQCGPHTIPGSAVDIRVVKCWFQSGVQIWDTKKCLLTPELLLKDDGLVKVDLAEKANYLRRRDASGGVDYVLISGKESTNLGDLQPRDADTLQPVDIEAESAKQFWITVHVPEDAVPGEYQGKVVLKAAGSAESELKLAVRVLPFQLEGPALRYSIYYRGRLSKDGRGSITSELKSPEQYEAEMRDLAAHGVEYPTVYQHYDEVLLPQMFKIRQRAGLPTGTLYTLGISTGCPTQPQQIEALKTGVKKWLAIAKEHGYDEVYVYGIDEATGERLKSQRAAWSAVREVGAKVFVACYAATFETMGDLLDLAIYAGRPVPEEAEKYHQVGHQIFCYANPQVGVEEPETYRRNFGLLLWKTGYDGAMDYAYQHSFGHLWNDFDHQRYRDHNFTYPTVNGVIDTIQWEGFREGVDDVRYVTTLQKMIEKVKGAKPKLAKDAEAWLAGLDVTGDLDGIRTETIEWILRLRGL